MLSTPRLTSLPARRLAPEKDHVDHDVEQHDQRRDPIHPGKFRELDQRQILIRGVAEQVPRKPDRKVRANPFDRRPCDRQRRHHRDPQTRRNERSRPHRRAGEKCHHRRQQHHRQYRQHHRHVGKMMQRDRHPVDRSDITREALQPRVQKYVAMRFAIDRIEQRHERHPRRKIEVEFRKRECQRESAGDCQRGASRYVHGYPRTKPGRSLIGITPAHGGLPSKRS